jgi:hypothetical protein
MLVTKIEKDNVFEENVSKWIKIWLWPIFGKIAKWTWLEVIWHSRAFSPRRQIASMILLLRKSVSQNQSVIQNQSETFL